MLSRDGTAFVEARQYAVVDRSSALGDLAEQTADAAKFVSQQVRFQSFVAAVLVRGDPFRVHG